MHDTRDSLAENAFALFQDFTFRWQSLAFTAARYNKW